MKKKLISSALLSLLFLTISFKASSQLNNTFSRGEILLVNSELKKGYLWYTSTIDKKQTVYYKATLESLSEEYYPIDIISFKIYERHQLYTTEAIESDGILKRIIVKVYFDGEYDLLSYTSPQANRLFIIDSKGDQVELHNSYDLPGRENNYRLEFGREYRQELMDMFGINNSIINRIEIAEYTPESIRKILSTYHKKMGYPYQAYPPEFISGYSLGIGPVFSSVEHISDIDDSFISTSPLFGIGIKAGILMSSNKVELFIRSNYLYGIIFHDDLSMRANMVNVYYEDIAETSILNTSLGFAFRLLRFGNFTPVISVGLNYNSYLKYSREVTEELLFVQDGIMVSSFRDDFSRPENYFGAQFGGGFEYGFNNHYSLKLDYSYSKFIGSETGDQNSQVISLTISKTIK